MAINPANLTDNYTVSRALGTPGFQQSNSAAPLGDIFRTPRERNIALGPIALLDAKLRQLATVNANGQLRLMGFFPSRPEQVNFDLAFYNRSGRRLLKGIALSTPQVREPRAKDSRPSRRVPLRALLGRNPRQAADRSPIAEVCGHQLASQCRRPYPGA